MMKAEYFACTLEVDGLLGHQLVLTVGPFFSTGGVFKVWCGHFQLQQATPVVV